MTRIMALDVGDARIGIALSDVLRVIAQPVTTIERKNRYIPRLLELIIENSVGELVVGLPLELDGTEGEQVGKVRGFVKKLKAAMHRESLNVIVHFFDERFTTMQAERVLAGSRTKGLERRRAVDRVSAAIILDSYLLCFSASKGDNL